MASVLLSSVIGGSAWKIQSASLVQTLSSGVTGDIITLTAPAGQLVKLYQLSCKTSGTQTGISVVSDDVTIVDQKELDDFAPLTASGTFVITRGFGSSSATNASAGILTEVIGKEVVIKKNAGNTGIDIEYAYEYGKA